MTPARRVALLALLLAVSAHCGKKGDPQPPMPRGARAVSDLAVEQEGAEAVLTFSFPDRLSTGERLTDLETIEVHRAVAPSPAITTPPKLPEGGTAPSGDATSASAGRRAASSVRVAEEAFYGESQRIARLRLPDLSRRTEGASIIYRDLLLPLLSAPRAGEPPSTAYAVVSVRRNGERSPLSNIALLAPGVPPGPPVLHRVTPEEGRICLEWSAPEKDILGGAAKVGGYRVYRRALEEPDYGAPLHPEVLSGTTYVDAAAPYGGTYVYTIRAALAEKPRVQGPPAEEVGLSYRDVFAPPAPARLDALPEEKRIRLIWDPVIAADLAGYIVFRAQEGAAPARLTAQPIPETFFADSTAVSGTRYRYTVRALDTAGNMSPPSQEAGAEAL